MVAKKACFIDPICITVNGIVVHRKGSTLGWVVKTVTQGPKEKLAMCWAESYKRMPKVNSGYCANLRQKSCAFSIKTILNQIFSKSK